MTTETVIDQKTTTVRKLKEPSKYKVLVLNDNHTPMEFVIAMFMAVFHMDQGRAFKLTMQIHEDGSAIAGVYTHEVAEQKVVDATDLARSNGYPLVLKAEQE